MRVILQQPDVLRELAFLKAALREKTDRLRLRTDTDALVLTASCSLCHLETRVPAGIVEAGEGLVMGVTFQRILDSLGPAQFTLSLADATNGAEIACGPFRANMPRPSEIRFKDPRLSIVYQHSLDIDAGLLKSLIKLASSAFPATGQEFGILFEANNDRTRLIATDGHRLNIASGPGVDADTSVIFAAATIEQISKSLDGYDGNVTINHNKTSHISVLAGTRVFRGSLLNVPFPPFERIVPKEFTSTVTVGREAFAKVIRRISLLGHHETPSVTLTFDGTELSCESKHIVQDNKRGGKKEEDRATDVVKIVEGSGVPFQIRVKSEYLLDSLDTIKTDRVQLLSVDCKNPMIVEPSSGDKNVRVVIMPMSLLEKAA